MCGQSESRTVNVMLLLFFHTQRRFLLEKHLLLYVYTNFLKFISGN